MQLVKYLVNVAVLSSTIHAFPQTRYVCNGDRVMGKVEPHVFFVDDGKGVQGNNTLSSATKSDLFWGISSKQRRL